MTPPSPAQLRNTLGANLRALTKTTPSISALCRDLGINRTQFNRYLVGESFPRPDVLFRICKYFDVDARIILEPLEDINTDTRSVLSHPEIAEFLSAGVSQVTEKSFPSGFYQFARRSFLDADNCVRGLIYVYRKDSATFLRGYEAKSVMSQQGLPTKADTREYRGLVVAQEAGVAALVSRRNSLTTSFNYLAQIPSFTNKHWLGYTIRTVRENVAGSRVTRLVYEHLGEDRARIKAAAYSGGYCPSGQLESFHRELLRLDAPFD